MPVCKEPNLASTCLAPNNSTQCPIGFLICNLNIFRKHSENVSEKVNRCNCPALSFTTVKDISLYMYLSSIKICFCHPISPQENIMGKISSQNSNSISYYGHFLDNAEHPLSFNYLRTSLLQRKCHKLVLG